MVELKVTTGIVWPGNLKSLLSGLYRESLPVPALHCYFVIHSSSLHTATGLGADQLWAHQNCIWIDYAFISLFIKDPACFNIFQVWPLESSFTCIETEILRKELILNFQTGQWTEIKKLMVPKNWHWIKELQPIILRSFCLSKLDLSRPDQALYLDSGCASTFPFFSWFTSWQHPTLPDGQPKWMSKAPHCQRMYLWNKTLLWYLYILIDK